MQGHALRPEEDFGGAQDQRILDAVERIAQDQMHKLIEEERRRRADAAAHEIEIGGFQRLVPHQVIAERDHDRPVLARIRIGDRRDVGGRDRAARIGQQCRMQRAFDRAGLRRRREFRPREIDLQEFVGDQQPAAFVMVEQMMAAGEPEILHFRSPCARPTRST